MVEHRSAQSEDQELVEAARAGDEHSFELLFERYRGRIASYATRMVGEQGEDVTQEVFIAALRSIRSSQRAIDFKPWIYEIARNACIDHLRRVRRRGEVASLDEPGGEIGAMCGPGGDPHATLEVRERFAVVRRALDELPPRQRELVALRELTGLSYGELAQRTAMSPSAVETTLHRARRRLIAQYQLLGGELPARRVTPQRAAAAA
jgi:RNA polymerase sigma factor (sigma-70 family)